MRRTVMILGACLILGIGYVAGMAEWPLLTSAQAQNAAVGDDLGVQVAEETRAKMYEAKLALQDAMDALETEGRYHSITDGVNSFLILSGGGDAMEDLESGRGVDPETFAALYAGKAIPEVADHLAFDAQKRLTYKGKVVRMYSAERLVKSYRLRQRFTEPGL